MNDSSSDVFYSAVSHLVIEEEMNLDAVLLDPNLSVRVNRRVRIKNTEVACDGLDYN
jgi:hypothetical protein